MKLVVRGEDAMPLIFRIKKIKIVVVIILAIMVRKLMKASFNYL